ncbi:MAG: complex I subunit 4 family protein [Opitutales bacterium]
MIAWTFLTALIGACLLFLLPQRWRDSARWIALLAVVAGLVPVLGTLVNFGCTATTGDFKFVLRHPWIETMGIDFHLGVDGISLVLIILTVIVALAGILFSWNITRQPQRFFALFLLIIAGAYGVFLSLDLFLFLVFYELVIIPKYFLIAGWGSTRKDFAAMKLTLYSIFGSALVIVGILAAWFASGQSGFDLTALAAIDYAPGLQLWAFPLTFLGFAILGGIWPFHTWVPTGHTAAPTAASMLLAGVVMKLGAYGALRVAMPLFPDGLEAWRLFFATLAAVGILWGACVALAQRDLKFVIAYSSISHMGFVFLGILCLSLIGVVGGVLQMVSHGFIAALLFAVVGRMLYDRTHTRDLSALGQLGLRRALPFCAFIFIAATAASIGLPGFSGFIAEVLVLLGSWSSFPLLLVLAAAGILVTVAFGLKAMRETLFAEPGETATARPDYPPITRPEYLGAILLLAASLGLGLYPQLWIEVVSTALNSEMMRVIFP